MSTTIGTATVTGATANGSYFFIMYDITNGKMVLGIVHDANGDNTMIEAGDTVALIGSANMSAGAYANIDTNHFQIVTA